MKLVAAAKLRRAQEKNEAARPYAVKLYEMISELAARANRDDHKLLAEREPKQVLVLTLTADRGLCGAFNANIIKAAEQFRREHQSHYEQINLAVVGRKGRDVLKYRNVPIHEYYPGVDVNTALERAKAVSDHVIEQFVDDTLNLDAVFLLYNEFKSAMQQQVSTVQLLPIVPMSIAPDEGATGDFIYEPNKDKVLEAVLPLYVRVQIYRAMLETTASELGARMTAMDKATTNAEEMSAALTLQYNKARQASITKELLEIVAGAEAQKG